MRAILADTGLFVALFSGRDAYHAAATEWLKQLNEPLVTNLPVIQETIYLLDFHPQAPVDFLNWVQRAATIDTQTQNDLVRIGQFFSKYRDLPADFTDASLVALAERLGIGKIASLDSDFQVYRLNGKQTLEYAFGPA